MDTLAIDLETYSSNDIKKCGVYKYVEADDFTILMLSCSMNGGEVETFDFTRPEDLDRFFNAGWFYLLTDPAVLKTAANAAFERTCLAKFFEVALPPDQWACTLVRAGMLGLPMSLDGVAKAMQLSEQKDAEGKKLIQFFSIPCKPTQANGMRSRNLPEHAPGKWRNYLEYNRQDVKTEVAILEKLSWLKIPQFEKDLWALDQQINDRGIRIDRDFVLNAIKLDEIYNDRLMLEAIELTGLDNPNSRNQLINWLNGEMGVEIKTLRKGDIPGLLDKAPSDVVVRVLELRQELAKTSVSKYKAMREAVCHDGRIRGLFQHYGANRTGRWAGRLVQVQNLPQNKMKGKTVDVLDYARQLVKKGDLDGLIEVFGNVPDILSQLIRTAFIPSDDYEFCVADFKAIEARVIAWLAGERWRLDVFEKDGDIYLASAAQMFGLDLATLTKENPVRQKGKVAELALGFQGGKNALIVMGALNMGLTRKELPGIVKAWRIANPHIVQMWWDVQAAAENAIRNPGKMYEAAKCKFFVQRQCLFIELPSGRRLSYINPKLIEEEVVWFEYTRQHGDFDEGEVKMLPPHQAGYLQDMGYGKVKSDPFTKTTITFMGIDQTSKKWGVQRTFGGRLVENIVQGTARDCLAFTMVNLDSAGYEIVMHVHDEVVVEVNRSVAEAERRAIDGIMSFPIPWARGLPLGVDSYLTPYYKKD